MNTDNSCNHGDRATHRSSFEDGQLVVITISKEVRHLRNKYHYFIFFHNMFVALMEMECVS